MGKMGEKEKGLTKRKVRCEEEAEGAKGGRQEEETCKKEWLRN